MGVLFFATGVLTYMYVRTGIVRLHFHRMSCMYMYRHPVNVSCVNRLPMHTYICVYMYVHIYYLLAVHNVSCGREEQSVKGLTYYDEWCAHIRT